MVRARILKANQKLDIEHQLQTHLKVKAKQKQKTKAKAKARTRATALPEYLAQSLQLRREEPLLVAKRTDLCARTTPRADAIKALNVISITCLSVQIGSGTSVSWAIDAIIGILF